MGVTIQFYACLVGRARRIGVHAKVRYGENLICFFCFLVLRTQESEGGCCGVDARTKVTHSINLLINFFTLNVGLGQTSFAFWCE